MFFNTQAYRTSESVADLAKKRLPIILIGAFFSSLLLLLHLVAIKYFLYWRIWWFDVPMHVIGGIILGIFSSWFLIGLSGSTQAVLTKKIWIILAATLLVGILWEVFEYVFDIANPAFGSYAIDTAKDLSLDIMGAILGALLSFRLIR